MNRQLNEKESSTYQFEREVIGRVLDCCHQETSLLLLGEKLCQLLTSHQLLVAPMALWQYNLQDKLTVIAPQTLDVQKRDSLQETFISFDKKIPFLKTKCVTLADSHSPFKTRVDVYLEKTSNHLFGISFWLKESKKSFPIKTPFLKEIFRLINLALLKVGQQTVGEEFIPEHTKQINHLKNVINKLTLVLEYSPVLVVITDTKGIIEYVNAKVLEETGYTSEELVGQHSRILQSEKTPPETFVFLWRQLLHGETWRGELINKNKKGKYFWVSAIMCPVRNEHNRVTHYLAVMEDISQKKSYEKMLRYQASYDKLTNLPNRFYGYSKLEQAITRAHQNNKKLAVFFLDLDEFKQINDSLGHAAGDLLLRALAERYLASMRQTDTIVRLGGDEFMIVLEDLNSEKDAETIAKKCQELCSRPFKIETHDIFISSSIGIAIFPNHGVDAKTLMRNADTAMYESKTRGKNSCTVFLKTMGEVTINRILIKSELYQVLSKDELYLCYQPIINIVDNKVFAAEALLRWRSATLGDLMPDQIIPVAEETGLIIPLGYWILRRVCNQIKQWQMATKKKIRIAVNISTLQLKQKDFIDQIKIILDETKISSESLIFEITESIFIDDSQFILSQLNQLSDMRIHCSLDDFGMGYSSLNYIRSYPFKSLKIDRAFIQGIDACKDNLSLVNSIITMSRNLKLPVIAEGIETSKQLELVRAMKCDMVQGWYFSKALTEENYLIYLNNN